MDLCDRIFTDFIFFNVFYNKFRKNYLYILESSRCSFPSFYSKCPNSIHNTILSSPECRKEIHKVQQADRSLIVIDHEFRSRRWARPRTAIRKSLPVVLFRCERRQKPIGRWRSALRCIIIIIMNIPARPSPGTAFSCGWNTKQTAFPVSGTNVSIYGCRLPAPTSYDIVSAGS